MKVKLGEREYLVYWRYDGNMTTCKIGKVRSDGKEADVLLLGVTSRHPGDPFRKEVARKVSLTRALKDSTPLGGGCKLSKPERTEFWKAYFRRRPGLRPARIVSESVYR